MNITYYPGCSLHSTAVEYNLSSEAVLQAMDIKKNEVNDWNCCGSTPAHATDEYLAKALPLRNLILAEGEGSKLVLPCTSCYNVFRQTHYYMKKGGSLAEEVNRDVGKTMGRQYKGDLQIYHLLDLFSQEEVIAGIANKVIRPLINLKVVAYYGCLMVRPAGDVAFDDPEQPHKLDQLMEVLGAMVMPWSYKTDCCGASAAIPRPEVVTNMVSSLVEEAKRAGAQAIVTACPLCQANLDTRQKGTNIPIYYFTELIALALNLPNQQRWLGKHITDASALLNKLGLLQVAG